MIKVISLLGCIFFFSSRRRHTRCLSDWSSDVCSSDLLYAVADGVTMPYGGGPATRLAISSFRSLFKGDLAETILQVNTTVLDEKNKSPGIGSSTLTAAHMADANVRIAHAGDSSALLIRE